MPDVTINVSKPAAYLAGGVVMIGRPDVMFSGDVGSQWTVQPQIVIPAPRRENRLVLVYTKVNIEIRCYYKHEKSPASNGVSLYCAKTDGTLPMAWILSAGYKKIFVRKAD